MMAMDALQAIMSRRSVRSYTGSPISRQQLRQIVSAGMQAPSAHGSSTWRFLTITDRAAMRGIIPYSPWWGLLDKAGALGMLAVGEPGKLPEQTERFDAEKWFEESWGNTAHTV